MTGLGGVLRSRGRPCATNDGSSNHKRKPLANCFQCRPEVREDPSTREQPGMASDVRIRTCLAAIEHLPLGIPSQAQQNKTLRAAFRLQVGMSVVQHAS